jgi:ABC-type sugar transport system ATPase subunit
MSAKPSDLKVTSSGLAQSGGTGAIGRLQGGELIEAPADVPVLEVENVSKHFGAVTACEDISLQLFSGEIVALAGHNGAGKSTVLKILSGVLQPDAGEIRLVGEPVRMQSVRAARAHGIETVPQELALAPKLSIAANIFLGRELIARPRFLRLRARRAMQAEAARLLVGLGVHFPQMKAKVGALSGGQAQAVAIARAIGWGRSVVVLDEPTAALGMHETQQVEQTIARMKDMRLGILIVSHDLDQMFRVADRIYVMYRGRIVGMEHTRETTRQRVGALIHGQVDNEQTAERSGEEATNA